MRPASLCSFPPSHILCVYVYMYAHVSKWRPETSLCVIPQAPSTILYETESLVDLELHQVD